MQINFHSKVLVGQFINYERGVKSQGASQHQMDGCAGVQHSQQILPSSLLPGLNVSDLVDGDEHREGYTHMHSHAYAHMHSHSYTHTVIDMHTRNHAHTHTPTHRVMHIHTCTQSLLHTCARTHTHSYTCTHMVMHMHSHAHAHTESHMYRSTRARTST